MMKKLPDVSNLCWLRYWRAYLYFQRIIQQKIFILHFRAKSETGSCYISCPRTAIRTSTGSSSENLPET